MDKNNSGLLNLKKLSFFLMNGGKKKDKRKELKEKLDIKVINNIYKNIFKIFNLLFCRKFLLGNMF